MDLTQLPPFDSLRDGDIVTLRGVVRIDDKYSSLRDVELAWYYENGKKVDVACSATLDGDDYRQCVIGVERAS